MDSACLYPDSIVDFILEELCCEGVYGVTFETLWKLFEQKLEVDELYKTILYSWILQNEFIEFIELKGEQKKENLPKIETEQENEKKAKDKKKKNEENKTEEENIVEKKKPEESKLIKVVLDKSNFPEYNEEALSKVHVAAAEEFQWLKLTGAPAINNSIGNSAFILLQEIARHRENGIDSLSLCKNTNQDSRSLTSRIKAISHLIKRIQIIKNGRTLSLFTLNKFAENPNLEGIQLNNKADALTFNVQDLREKIVNTVKAAKSMIRQINDLRRELEMEKTPKAKTVFKSVINYLESRGYLAKVLVVSPVSPSIKFRSVKYLKDYVPVINEQETPDDLDDNDLELNEDLIDDELKELDEDNEPSASLKNVVNLQVLDVSNTKNDTKPMINRFYPIQNQIYQLVHSHGTAGCASHYLNNELFGSSFTRLFSRLIESYTSVNLIPYMANYGIIRHYDFQGRVKFYRYVSRKNFLALSQQPQDPQGSTLPPYEISEVPYDKLNEIHFTALVGITDIYEDNNHKLHVSWNAGNPKSIYKDLPPNKVKVERKKIAKITKKAVQKTKEDQRKKEAEGAGTTDQETATETETTAEPGVSVKDEVKSKKEKEPKVLEPLVISNIQGTSFKSIERQSAILRILNDSDGVRSYDHELLEDIREEQGYIVDRKTYKRDIDSLLAQGMFTISTFIIDKESNTSVDLIVVKDTSEDVVDAFKNSLLKEQPEKYALKTLDEVSLDLDFFDTELRETFNKPPKIIEPSAPKPPKSIIKTKNKRSNAKKPPRPKKVKPVAPEKVPQETSEEQIQQDKSNDLFKGLNKKQKKRKREARRAASEEPETLPSSTVRKSRGRGSTRKRTGVQLSSAKSLLFFKAVIICKTINSNQIDWPKIRDLLQVDIDTLRLKWPRIRMMMGPIGIKVARRTWKRILLAAVKDGRIDMEVVEDLDLDALVELWQDSELLGALGDGDDEKLYVNIEDNWKEFKFVKVTSYQTMQYDNNSMVQREQYLINNVSTYSEEGEEGNKIIKNEHDEMEIDEQNDEVKNKEKQIEHELIRKMIIAIVAGGNDFEIKKLSILEQFKKESINEVFLNMAKNRELLISGTNQKVLLGDKLTTILDDHTYQFSIEKISKFQNILKDLLENDKVLILDQIFDNELMVPILELIFTNGLNLIRIDHYRKEVLTGYEARTLEREKLNSDIILSPIDNSLIKTSSEKKVIIPSGRPCSHIWIDLTGNINKDIWIKVLRVVSTTILSNPGITKEYLLKLTSPLLDDEDLGLILNWLLESKCIKKGEFEGYWLYPQWYMSLGF